MFTLQQHKGQEYLGCRCAQFGQPGIVIGTQYIGVAKQDIEQHGARPLCQYPLQHLGMNRACPGVAAMFARQDLQAGLIDIDQHHLTIRL